MVSERYDIVVVGAGPSGLSAGRTAARLGFRTLVLERLAAPGDLAHPCGTMVSPVPGSISVRRSGDGLRIPELDLLIPASLTFGFPAYQRLVSPAGHALTVMLPAQDDSSVAVIDKPGLLQLLADQAAEAGAELRFGISVVGLAQQDGRVTGVRTGDQTIEADLVLCAEGIARQLSEEAGLFAKVPQAKRYAFVVSQELEAPAVRAEHLGQIVTFGKRYTSAREAFGAVLLPAPGRAWVQFTMFADGPRHHSERSLRFYIDEYMERDPRIKEFVAGARVLNGASHRMVLRAGPAQAVRDGLMGLGDAITPAGHLGVLPAIQSGRQAALIAAEALDAGDVSAARLAGYERLVRMGALNGVDAERRLITGIMRMADEEIDRLCEALPSLRRNTPFSGTWRMLAWEAVGLLVKQFPLVSRDWELLERIVDGSETTPVMPAARPNGIPVAVSPLI